MQDQDSMNTQIMKLIQQNETQRVLLSDIKTFLQSQQDHNHQAQNGNVAVAKDLNDMVRENDELRKQNEELRRKVDRLEKTLRDLNLPTDNDGSENVKVPDGFSDITNNASNAL
ncbi:14812_t:CDS:2 [Acaulospora colombiana]|uniref:14812_t:CDS:1 n=1 Tax=Acaulospora colombiana TaxID=27376 RepID=A0ACA9LG47_9GLOM|nr:14812_t:CDS:2 [Acaulospora colombiana]